MNKYVKRKIFVELFCVLKKRKKKGRKILEFKQCMITDKMLYIIYADIEYLILKKSITVKIIQKNHQPQKLKNIPCKNLVSTIWAFDHIENKQNFYCGIDCINVL